MSYQTTIRRAILQGTTPRITFQIVDEDRVGFKPSTLTMSIYDVAKTMPTLYTSCTCCSRGLPCSTHPTTCDVSTVNERDDVDVIASCDAAGHVQIFLEAGDTDIEDQDACQTKQERRILFTWTWSSGAKVGKHLLIVTIAADQEGLAAA